MPATFRAFDTPEELYATLADTIAARLRSAIDMRAYATLVASGGSTPGELYDQLCDRELKWQKVTITLSDERWVVPESDRSNEKFLRARLLRARASAASLIPLKTNDARAANAEAKVHSRIAKMRRPFDVVLLGMGTDGHTASLIPNSNGLERALDASDPALARAIIAPPETGLGERMTLSLRALLDARVIYVLIRGEEKRAAYEHATRGRDARETPVRAVLSQIRVPVETLWAP